MKKVKKFRSPVEAVRWIDSQEEPDNYLMDWNVYNGKFEVYLIDQRRHNGR